MPPNDGDSIDLDLIDMVQRARMLHDADAMPSDFAAVYWIEAKRQPGHYPAATNRAGEWRVSLTAENVDAVWTRVKAATIAGQLGYKSKVSTRPAFGQAAANARMICVRTYDSRDADDVERARLALEQLGVNEMNYVTD